MQKECKACGKYAREIKKEMIRSIELQKIDDACKETDEIYEKLYRKNLYEYKGRWVHGDRVNSDILGYLKKGRANLKK